MSLPSVTSQFYLIIPGSSTINPTLFFIDTYLDLTLSWSSFKASYPINLSRFESGFLLNTVHIKEAYKGVISGLISCPCKQRPPYNLKESLDPSPAHWSTGLLSNFRVILTIWDPVPAISNPSSPVYPDLVIMY